MEGLEEFATFMSYKSDFHGLRILSVETVEEAKLREAETKSKAKILPFAHVTAKGKEAPSQFHKELKFFDQIVH